MAGDITPYTNLVTSEHQDKPNYMAMLGVSFQPFADILYMMRLMSAFYDIDNAVGYQLDVCGEWIGLSRELKAPIAGVYFAFDTVGVGFDQGVWQGPNDPSSGLVSIPDDHYRLLLKAKILNNHWNGSVPDAITLANLVFNSYGYKVFIQDNNNLTMDLGLVGATPPDALLFALFTSGLFNIKPAGVLMENYFTQSVAGPLFGFDINNSLIAGFDVGGWAILT